MLAPLPVADPDPVSRLAQIAQAARERKRYPPYQPEGRFAQRATVRVMSRQRLVNLFTSNLPGPPTRCIWRARESWPVSGRGGAGQRLSWEWG